MNWNASSTVGSGSTSYVKCAAAFPTKTGSKSTLTLSQSWTTIARMPAKRTCFAVQSWWPMTSGPAAAPRRSRALRAISSIHSAPGAVASKSKRTLCGSGQSGPPGRGKNGGRSAEGRMPRVCATRRTSSCASRRRASGACASRCWPSSRHSSSVARPRTPSGRGHGKPCRHRCSCTSWTAARRVAFAFRCTLSATRSPPRTTRPKSAPTLASNRKHSTASGHIVSTSAQMASGSVVPKSERTTGSSGSMFTRSARGSAGSRCAGALRRPPSPARAFPGPRRRRECGAPARSALRRPPAEAPRARGGRCRERSSPRACGSADDGRRAWGGSRRRETPRSPRSAPARWDARSCRDLLEQVADLVLDLGAEAAENRELDAPVLPAQVPLRLRQAADRPADVAGQLPVVELLRPDVEAGELVVALEIFIHVADAAEALVVGAEAPCTHEAEAEIAAGVVEVRELPVEDADEPALVDDEVADAVVAVVHDGRTVRRAVLAQPPQAELDRRMRIADVVELVHHPFQPRLL